MGGENDEFLPKSRCVSEMIWDTAIVVMEWQQQNINALRSSEIFSMSSKIILVIYFLPARRYASAGYRDRNVSVCLSVCLSVRHAPALCQNEES